MKCTVMSRRNFGAILLLAPLLFIHIVKFFHSHEWNIPLHSSISDITTDSVVEKPTSFTCTICDYHLAKDVYVKKDIVEIVSPVYFHTFSSVVKSFINCSSNLTRSDRGPPAFLI